jgi:hypothetical protein
VKGSTKKKPKKTAEGKKGSVKGKEPEEQVEEAYAEQRDKRYIATTGKDAASESKTTLMKVLWELVQSTPDPPKYYHVDYKFEEMSAEDKENKIKDLRNVRKLISEKALGITLDKMPDDQLYFFWWILIHRKLKNKSETGDQSDTLVALLQERMQRLGLIIER